ncbi:hypothetical protein [Microbacterium sp. bgisy189]|uniref:hypothetical protein n=1 Tax=Microbacterium sp. bgisy189 TaxID=3413798 RepID=UPI003EBFFE4B
MANRTRFITIDTRQYTEAAGEIASNRARQQREEDLNAYGTQGYALLSTVTIPTHDGLRIVDTLARTDEGY